MKNTRRTFVRTLAVSTALILGGTLAGCSAGNAGTPGSSANPGGGKPDTSRPANEIHIYAFGDAAASVEQAAADRFNKTSKVKVVVDKGADGGADYATQVRTTIGTKNAPDIFMSWGSAGIADFVKGGAVLSLNDFIKDNPKLKSSFLPSVFNEEVVSGQSYGIPMRGVGPVVLYYNKSVLQKNGLEPATSLEDLQSQVTKLSGAGVTPVALSGADKWPTLMWFEYLYTRALGNEDLNKGLKGDQSVWSSAASKKALTDLSALVKSGAFGTKYASVKYGNDGSPKLLSTGKAAYELMGNWNYGTIAAGDKNFAANDLGWTAFPSVSGATADPTQLTGNLSNYYNVSANTRYPDTVAKFLTELYSADFQKGELAIGNLPPTTDASTYIDQSNGTESSKSFLKFQLDLIQKAPSFQLSWDQVVPTSQSANLLNNVASYFSGAESQDQFISTMQQIVSAK